MLSVKQGSYKYQFYSHRFDPTRNQTRVYSQETDALTTWPSELLVFSAIDKLVDLFQNLEKAERKSDSTLVGLLSEIKRRVNQAIIAFKNQAIIAFKSLNQQQLTTRAANRNDF